VRTSLQIPGLTLAGDDLEESPARRAVERNLRVVDAATAVAARHSRPIPQIALAWLLGVAGVTAPVIGPRTLDQLEGLLNATEFELSDEDRLALEAPAPPPEVSPHRMLRGQIGQPDVPALRRSGRG
jgi:aryl-alcohol dehydrogenase-like predicted oxidoreductase